jgi:hypothetical protein
MAIDPSIPLQYQSPKISTPYESMQGALTLRQMMDEAAARPQELALRQEQLQGLQDYRAQMMAARAEDQRLRQEEQQQKARLGIIGGVKKAIGNAAGMFLMGGDPRQAYQQALDGIIKQFNMTPEEQQGLVKTLGSPEEFSVERAEQILQGGADQHLFPMADYLIKTRGPTLMTDEGEIVQGGQEGEFVPTGPVAEEGAEWYTQPYAKWTTDQKRNFGRIFNMGLAAKAWKKSDPTLTLPNGVTVDNPYYWQSKEKEYQLRQKYKIGTGSEINIGYDPLGKATETKVQTEAIDVDRAIQRLDDIQEGFSPEYLKLPKQLAMKGLEFLEKIGGDLSDEQRDSLTAYTNFKFNASDNMNRYIKELTGAAMSELEANRLRKAIPDPENDSPTVFKAKMDRSFTVLRRAGALYKRLLAKGIPIAQVENEMISGLTGASKPKEAPKEAPKQSPKQPLKAGQELQGMPNPADAPNAIIRAPDGSRYKSDGKRWNKL